MLGLDSRCVVAFNILGRIYQPPSTQEIIKKTKPKKKTKPSVHFMLSGLGCSVSLGVLDLSKYWNGSWSCMATTSILGWIQWKSWILSLPNIFPCHIPESLHLGAEIKSSFNNWFLTLGIYRFSKHTRESWNYWRNTIFDLTYSDFVTRKLPINGSTFIDI